MESFEEMQQLSHMLERTPDVLPESVSLRKSESHRKHLQEFKALTSSLINPSGLISPGVQGPNLKHPKTTDAAPLALAAAPIPGPDVVTVASRQKFDS